MRMHLMLNESNHDGAPRAYQLSGPIRPLGLAVLVLVTAGFLLGALGSAIRTEGRDYEQLLVLPVLLYFWYWVLAPVRRILLFDDGRLEFHRGLATVRTSVREVRSIRPMFGFSGNNFVLKSIRGSVLLMNDPTLVALFVDDLRALNPEVDIRGIGERPGARLTR